MSIINIMNVLKYIYIKIFDINFQKLSRLYDYK
jgi:hypothetical protein